MKLHQLVNLRNELQKAVDLSVIKKELGLNQTRLAGVTVLSDEEKYTQLITSISAQQAKLIDLSNDNLQQIQDAIDEINQDISKFTEKFFHENYQTECLYHDPGAIRAIRKMHIIDEAATLLVGRIQLYSSWKYPALEIGCRDGEWTKYLVSSDPLYIADDYQEFIDSTMLKFTPEYQARLRRYLIQDYHIHRLPNNQFSFIFSFNFFNYLSLDSIKQILLQAMNWLRPGGTILFTYNNADLPASAGLSENYFMTYVPKSMLIPLVESIGFEVVLAQDFEPSTSWIELKKPGTLTTVKAHQSLGEIKYR